MNSKLSLTITKQISVLNNILLNEPIDNKLLDKLINSKVLKEEEWFNLKNEKHQLTSYKKKIKNGSASVKYDMSKIGYGRVYPSKGLGLCSLRREIRHTIAQGWVDIDIENCHPVLLEQICKNNNIDCPQLSNYCLRRDECLKLFTDEYGVSRDTAKDLFIRLLYFGTFNSWLKDNNLELIETVNVLEFEAELKLIGSEIIIGNTDLYNAVKKLKSDDATKNLKASTVSFYLQEYERRVLEVVYTYLLEHGKINNNEAVLCFDGIMIRLEHYTDDLLELLSAEVFEKIGFKLKFTRKGLDNGYKEEEIVKSEVQTEQYNQYKDEFEKDFFKLNNPLRYCKQASDEVIFYNKENFKEYMIDKYINDEFDFCEKWRKDPVKRVYDKIVFNPATVGHTKTDYNLFQGFCCDNDNVYDFKDFEETSKFFQLLKYLCNDEAQYKFTKSWIAHIIQTPKKKTNTAIVFYSEIGGIGKDAIIDGLLKLFGQYAGKVEKIDDLTKQFNANLCNKLFIYGDEINANAKKIADLLKCIITRTEQNMEKKGIDTVKIADYSNYMFTTNNELCFKLDEQDRRYFMIRCPDIPLEKQEYIDYYSYIEDEEEIKKLFSYLKVVQLDYDIGIERAPMTKYKETIVYETKPAYIQMLYKRTGDFCGQKIKSSTLCEMSKEYAKKQYLSSNYSITEYGTKIKKYIEVFMKKSHGVNLYTFPSLNELRAHLYKIDKEYYKYINNIPENEEPTFTDAQVETETPEITFVEGHY